MRKIAVAMMILFSLMVIPNSIGQNPTPTAAISLDCDSDPIEVSHLYEVNGSETFGYKVDFDPSIVDHPIASGFLCVMSRIHTNSPTAISSSAA